MNLADGSKIAPPDVAKSEVQLLRAFVERAIPARSVVLVTSALGGDGKSLTAYSLADCLARSGRRTAIVDATTESQHYVRLPNTQRSEQDGELAVYVPAPKAKTPLYREAASRFVETLRSAHEFTIIDSAALLQSEMAMALAETVDGVLLSVRLGRAPAEDDEQTLRMLERSAGNVLGVVAASAEAIEEFEGRGAGAKSGSLNGISLSWMGAMREAFAGLFAHLRPAGSASLLRP